jgi:chromate transporter
MAEGEQTEPLAREAARSAGGSVAEVAAVFGKLGTVAFGGPAAHIAMMRDEVVRRRGWVSEQEFLDLLGATNLIPGPNSTEMAIHLGYRRAGWPGLLAGGACFILPAVAIVTAIAWAYVAFGTLPAVGWLLYGVKPVIIAIVAHALWGLTRTAVKGPLTGLIALAALVLALAGVNELALLAAGLVAGALARLPLRRGAHGQAGGWALGTGHWALGTGGLALAASAPVSLGTLFWTFVKIGSVLYGSGYVLLAFLRGDFVERLGWLTEQQLLDAVAVGQFTPGPVFTTATFIGYVVAGLPGALAATVGIFLPAFGFVALTGPFVGRLRAWRWTAGPLDGVNAAALGLMAAVTVALGQAAIFVRGGGWPDPLALALALVTLALLLRTKVNSAWLVLAGGLIGVVARLLSGA